MQSNKAIDSGLANGRASATALENIKEEAIKENMNYIQDHNKLVVASSDLISPSSSQIPSRRAGPSGKSSSVHPSSSNRHRSKKVGVVSPTSEGYEEESYESEYDDEEEEEYESESESEAKPRT